MKDRQRTSKGIGRYAILCVTGAILGIAYADPALADAVKAKISKPIPAYRVVSNGSSYTQVQGALLPAKFTVKADAEIAGKVTAISYKASAATSYPGGELFELSSQSDSRHFDPVFDKELLAGRYQPAADELAAACNQMADGLRAQGKSDTEIFAQDRHLTMTVSVLPDASFTVPSPFMDQATDSAGTQVTCSKWAGTVGFSPPAKLAATDGVSDASLTLIEQYGPGGMCQVTLSGVITTTAADMEVKFRYEHFDGKKSEVKTVTTDASKTAFFSHEYAIPDQEGPEGGSIRMIGISPSFTSNTAAYSMDCSTGGPGSVQASLLPEVSLQAAPRGNTPVGGQSCPSEMRLQAKIAGQGGGTVSGQAFFVGPGYASPHQTYEISGTEVLLLEESLALTWDAGPAQSFTTGQAPAPAKTQTVIVGFNLLGADNTQIANVPQKSFTVSCDKAIPPVAQGSNVAAKPSQSAPAVPVDIRPNPRGSRAIAIPTPQQGPATAPEQRIAIPDTTRVPEAGARNRQSLGEETGSRQAPTVEQGSPTRGNPSGLPTGKRQHAPFGIRKPVDKSQPLSPAKRETPPAAEQEPQK